MTNKAQTMLTIALTFAVSVLLVDRIIEPAQARDCASPFDVMSVETAVLELSNDMMVMQASLDALKSYAELHSMYLEDLSSRQ